MKAFIITKDKKLIEKEIDASEPFFIYKSGAYKIDSECIKLRSKQNHINPQAELYYVEGNSTPLTKLPKPKIQGKESEEESVDLLDEVVIQNWIENVKRLQGESIFDKIEKLFSFKLAVILLALLFAVVIIRGFLTGEIHI